MPSPCARNVSSPSPQVHGCTDGDADAGVTDTHQPRRGATHEIGRRWDRGRHQASLSAALASADGQRRKAKTTTGLRRSNRTPSLRREAIPEVAR